MKIEQRIVILILSGVICLGCGKKSNPPAGVLAERTPKVLSTKINVEYKPAGPPITNSIGMRLAWIPPGTFQMGSDHGRPNEKPIHSVTISKGFYMGIYEITQKQYQTAMGTNPSRFKDTSDDENEFKFDELPVESVSWDEAVEFCKKLSQKEGKTYRLPTEAEWEYACRAGTTTVYCFGDRIDHRFRIRCKEDGIKHTSGVGSTHDNKWGLHSMHGNVWEWCQDIYDKDYYSRSSENDPQGPISGKYRVIRGGSWQRPARICTSSFRLGANPGYRSDGCGFRIVMDSE